MNHYAHITLYMYLQKYIVSYRICKGNEVAEREKESKRGKGRERVGKTLCIAAFKLIKPNANILKCFVKCFAFISHSFSI